MEPALSTFAVCAIILFVKMLAISTFQGYHRFHYRTFQTPEDATALGYEPATEESPGAVRGAKAWRNDLENIPIFLALGLAGLMLEASPTMLAWIFALFTIARVGHTASFLMALQPWRFIFYTIGVAATLVLCVVLLANLGG